MADIYVMPSFPMLTPSDLDASARWYQEVLGFEHIFSIPPAGAAMLVHLRWTKYADLLLTRPRGPADASPKGVGVTLYYQAQGPTQESTRTVDDIATAARNAGATVVGPIDQPWNAREVTVTDPDGFRLTFTQVISFGRSFDDVVKGASVRDAG